MTKQSHNIDRTREFLLERCSLVHSDGHTHLFALDSETLIRYDEIADRWSSVHESGLELSGTISSGMLLSIFLDPVGTATLELRA